MCGIGGYVGGFVPELMSRMNLAQRHRGPNGSGVFEDPEARAALCHVRLAILDLSDAAAQPMHSPEGRFVLSYNGEIYNFRELRAELEAAGEVFQSSGDTEVLLRLVRRAGVNALLRLNGIFSLAVWDRQERELILARDPLGVKPLYIAEPRPGDVLFASEIKALCLHPALRREPDFQALQQHLAYNYSSGVRTALRGVRRLAPGHLLRWRASSRALEIRRYWNPSFAPLGETRDEEAPKLQGLVARAVERQLVSDAPVGTLLSGGLDSSLVTTLAARRIPRDLKCYTVSFSPEENRLAGGTEDLPFARIVARELGVELREIEVKPEVADLWPRLVHSMDEPIADPAAISSYLIARFAAEDGTKVLLSGQGADELFCGYPRYPAMYWSRWLDYAPRWVGALGARLGRRLPGGREGRTGATLRRVRRVLTAFDQPCDQRFLSYCAYLPETALFSVISRDFRAAVHGTSYMADCLDHMARMQLDGFNRMRERDLSIYLPNHNLLYTDKTAMATGVEARVPLLDVELTRRVLRYPTDWLLGLRETKAILRRAARGVVPEAIISRPKTGFTAPLRKWLRYDLADAWNELTSERAVRERGWFDHAALLELRERSQSGKEDLYPVQWAVLTAELWARQFIDRNPAEGALRAL